MLWFAGFITLVALLILWALVIAPRRARGLLAGLETRGWSRVEPVDEGLRSSLEALRPFDLTAYLDDNAVHPDAIVAMAMAGQGPKGTRYLAQLRVHSTDAFRETVISFNTVFLEPRALSFAGSSVYVLARDREDRVAPRIDILGLRAAASGLDPGFAGLFLALHAPGADAPLPGPLQQALLASADLFVSGAGERGRYFPNASLRLCPTGFVLLVPEPIVTDGQFRAFLDTADRVSEALSGC